MIGDTPGRAGTCDECGAPIGYNDLCSITPTGTICLACYQLDQGVLVSQSGAASQCAGISFDELSAKFRENRQSREIAHRTIRGASSWGSSAIDRTIANIRNAAPPGSTHYRMKSCSAPEQRGLDYVITCEAEYETFAEVYPGDGWVLL